MSVAPEFSHRVAADGGDGDRNVLKDLAAALRGDDDRLFALGLVDAAARLGLASAGGGVLVASAGPAARRAGILRKSRLEGKESLPKAARSTCAI